MHERELYRPIMGIQAPRETFEVEVGLPSTGGTVHILQDDPEHQARRPVIPRK